MGDSSKIMFTHANDQTLMVIKNDSADLDQTTSTYDPAYFLQQYYMLKTRQSYEEDLTATPRDIPHQSAGLAQHQCPPRNYHHSP